MTTDSPRETVSLDIEDLTLGELDTIEEMSGQSIAVLNDPSKPKAKLLRAIALVVKRREDPTFSWEQTANLHLEMEEGADDPFGASDS